MARAIALAAVASLLLCSGALAAAPARTTPIVVKVTAGGFRLADAAVGAVAGAGAVVAVAGLVVLLRLKREDTAHPQKGELQ